MLPKSQRLNLKTDFKWVVAGKKIDTKFVGIFLKSGDNLFPRVGIAVSGKHFKKAVDRNRAKRLVSKAFESLYPNLPKDVNIVALPKLRVLEVKSSEVLLDLQEALRKAGII